MIRDARFGRAVNRAGLRHGGSFPQRPVGAPWSYPPTLLGSVAWIRRAQDAWARKNGPIRGLTLRNGRVVWGGGGAEGDRTPDLRIANATLSQLSYGPDLV